MCALHQTPRRLLTSWQNFRQEFSHTVMHGVKTELSDVSHLETAKKAISQAKPPSSSRPTAAPAASSSNRSTPSTKHSPVSRPSPTASKAGASPPVYPSYPAAQAGYPAFPSPEAVPKGDGSSPKTAQVSHLPGLIRDYLVRL